MTKAQLLKHLESVPDNAEITAWNPDEGAMVPVSGILHGPSSGPRTGGAGEAWHSAEPNLQQQWDYVVELCTDDA